MKKQTRTFVNSFLLVLFILFSPMLNGYSQTNPADIDSSSVIISDPVSVDSLFILNGSIYEGDTILLFAATTHGSSPCGLLNYSVSVSGGNIIMVNAKYWQGMLTTLCHSYDKFILGTLPAGKYVLNFMNKAKLEFWVYSKPVSCKADFTFVPTKCSGLKCDNAVAFSDNSTGNITSWYWNFGDSTFSTLQNPHHSYKNAGVYTVCLTINGNVTNSCTDKICKTIAVGTSCQAKFEYKVTELPTMFADNSFAPMPLYHVQFVDKSAADSILSWYWEFGDSTFSTLQNPTHVYRSGKYTVFLSIKTLGGCSSTYVDTLYLKNSVPFCQYTGTVKYYGGIDGCKYIIELDNGIKLEPFLSDTTFKLYDKQRVILDYEPIRLNSVCMVGITARITCIREINQPNCKAQFRWVWDRMVRINGYLFKFYDTSEGKTGQWYWDFGDGTTSNLQNPTHVYPMSTTSRKHFVCLTITTTDGCTSSYCDTVFADIAAPWVPVIGGEENHSIIVPEAINNGNLEVGDYIGLFFRNYGGNLVCGGMAQWENKNTVLTAWQNKVYLDTMINTTDSILNCIILKNGFNPGEKFEYKIWKYRTGEEILVNTTSYLVNKLFPDSGYFTPDGLSYIKSFNFCNKQQIYVNKGWNLLSLNVIPENASMSAIFGNRNVVVKNYRGEIVYFPVLDIKEGVWDKYEGYKVKSLENFWLKVEGKPIYPQTTIPLPGNKLPYFLPYYFNSVLPIAKLMDNYNTDIRYVQSLEYINGVKTALFYIPKYNIDQIKWMKPGLGYKLALYTSLASFTYPSFADSSVFWVAQTPITENLLIPESENNRILIIPDNTLPVNPGSTIMATTTDGTQVGEVTYDSGNTALALWDLDSGLAYDKFFLMVNVADKVQKFEFSFSGSTTRDGDLYILQKTTGIPEIEDGLIHAKVYPTLVKTELYLQITLDSPSDIEFSVISITGKTMLNLKFDHTNNGQHILNVDVSALNTGQYIYQVKTRKGIATGKIQKE